MLRRIFFLFTVFIFVAIVLYVALWLQSRQSYPLALGVTFSRQHAEWLGLNWKETYRAMLTDLKPRYIRLSARWDEVEPQQGKAAYGDIDWMMNEAARYGTRVLLTVGQKHPRWPECYIPSWVTNLPSAERRAALLSYVHRTVERYNRHPALDMWQVENEPFIGFRFGECELFDEDAIGDEVKAVRSLPPLHLIVVTDSGELATWRRASRTGDILGATMYRCVLTPRGFRFGYSLTPPAMYGFKARLWRVSYERFFISELQAEPWMTGGDPRKVTIAEMERTMTPEQLMSNLTFARHSGASRAYLWGTEWWYWMKKEKGDARYWETVKREIANERNEKKLEKF